MGHRYYCCDGCETHNFHGRRYHCLRCVNYDLCYECYGHHVETLHHRNDHPMQLLLDHELPHHLPEVMSNGEVLELMHLPNCYTCPYCGIFGHTAKELIDHVVTVHCQADTHVVCPMCAGLPGIELFAIRNLARHLLLNHIEHANLLDPHTPPLRHSLARISRRRRRQQTVTLASASAANHQLASNSRSSARSNSSRIDTEPGIDIVYQLSELRRLRPQLPANNPEADPRPRPAMLAITSPEPQLPAPPEQYSDKDRYLLQHWMADQHAKLELEAQQDNGQREQHTLFAEHLLLSMLCEEQLQLPDTATEMPKPEPDQGTETFTALLEPSPDGKSEDLASMYSCKYIPSQIMMLMSLPWTRPWSTQSQLRYIQLQGVTLDESRLTGVDQQDID